MKVQEYRNLRINDPIIDKKGNLTKAYDIDRNARTIKTSLYGGGWRDFHEIQLPISGRKTESM